MYYIYAYYKLLACSIYMLHLASDIFPLIFSYCVLNYIKAGEIIGILGNRSKLAEK